MPSLPCCVDWRGWSTASPGALMECTGAGETLIASMACADCSTPSSFHQQGLGAVAVAALIRWSEGRTGAAENGPTCRDRRRP